jgi:hypothetical protein
MALGQAGAAVDKEPKIVDIDQRGFPCGTQSDIGAFEVQ